MRRPKNLAGRSPPPPYGKVWPMSERSREICLAVCADHDIPIGWVLSRSRYLPVVKARRECWWRLFALRRADGRRVYYMAAIARMFGMTHGAVSYALRDYRKALVSEQRREAA